jgi:hypothetical protein
MTFHKNSGRQEVVSAYVDIALGDLVSGAATEIIDLPVGAQIVGGDVVVDTAFNSGTSDVIVVGDALVANRYLGSTSIAAAARTALVPTGYRTLATSNKVKATITSVGTAATTGQLRVRVDYIVNKRAAFAQG